MDAPEHIQDPVEQVFPQNVNHPFLDTLSLYPFLTQEQQEEEQDLAREAAFNLSLIYKRSGTPELALRLYHEWLQF